MHKPYVYKWTHIPTLKWYVGSRTANGCHPGDGYICSSRVVKPLIELDPKEWKREILHTGNREQVLEFEAEVLRLFDARNDKRSFNMHNGDGKFTTSGKKLPPRTKEHLLRMSLAHKGRQNTWLIGKPGHKKNVGKKHSEEWKENASERQRGEKNRMYGRKGQDNPNYGRKMSEASRQKMRGIKKPSPARVSCLLCKKETTQNNLNQHINSNQCVGSQRPKFSCLTCKKELWSSSKRNHYLFTASCRQ
jgi:hypothetical protein